ncbi:MAG: NIPSNAP family protein [Gaiellaceae bacterium]
MPEAGAHATPVLDLRTYRLVPGGRDAFDRIFREDALPMLRRHGVQVVAYGPSIADDHHYYLARAFPSAARREEQLDSFYGSDEWRRNHEDAVTELIETYHVVVLPLTPALRRAFAAAGPEIEDEFDG